MARTLIATRYPSYMVSGTDTPDTYGDWTFTIDIYRHDPDIANNRTKIECEIYLRIRNADTGYRFAPNSSWCAIGINNENKSIYVPDGRFGNGYYIGSREWWVKHNSVGEGSAKYIASANSVNWNSTWSGPTTYSLPTIPRATSITSMTTSNITLNSVKVNWSTAHNVSQVWGSVGSGWVSKWTGNAKSGSFTMTGLEPNKTYSLGLKVKRADSGVETEKWISFKTLDIARITSAPDNINPENEITVNVSNPSGAGIGLAIYTEDFVYLIDYKSQTSTNQFKFTLTQAEINAIYNQMSTTNSKQFNFRLRTVADGRAWFVHALRTFKVTNANPIFTNFAYENTNIKLPSGMNERILTGSSTKFIKGYSSLKATITGSNLATAQKGASMKEYKLNIQGMPVETKTVSNNVVITKEKITNSSVKVLAVDTRDNNTTVSKTVDLIDYNPIKINNVKVERQDGGVGHEVKLSLDGTFCNCNFGAMNNTVNAIYQYKLPSETEYELGLTDIVLTKSGNNFSVSNLSIIGDNSGFTQGQSFDIRITVKDQVASDVFNIVLGSGTPNIALHKDGTAIGGMYDETLDKGVQLYGDNLYYNKLNLLDWFYPIGSIYETTSSSLNTVAKMNAHFGGTWEVYGNGRVTVGYNSSGTFNTIEKTGGAETHTLTISEMPSHSHKGFLSGGSETWPTQASHGGYKSGRGTQDITSTGGGQAHNNLQPYIVVYRYRRTA